MDTARIDIAYRPLRIAWAIHSNDVEGFRRCVRHSHTLAGGRYNPIVLADGEGAADIVRAFRADFIYPVGDSAEVAALVAQFRHIPEPYFGNGLHYQDIGRRGRSRILDIENLLTHMRTDPQWQHLANIGFCRGRWADDDPLCDAFLIELGAFPSTETLGIDYGEIFELAAKPSEIREVAIEAGALIPIETAQHPSIAVLSRLGLQRHYSIDSRGRGAGFYVGDASSIHDLVEFWNLRAADTMLRFFDTAHTGRYALVHAALEEQLSQTVAHLDDFGRRLSVYSPNEMTPEAVRKIVPNEPAPFMNGTRGVTRFARPPMMVLGQATALGVVSVRRDRPAVSFALSDKPFNGDIWFYSQHLVASLKVLGGLIGHEQHTLELPFLPDLNEPFARKMGVKFDALRVEPERVGVVIDAADHDLTISALPDWDVVEAVLKQVGLNATLSNAGLMTRQLITQMGGIDQTRAFKIPGVRRLIKTYGPTTSFTKRVALRDIGSADPDNPGANFADHARLFIEPRPMNEPLTAKMVFSHLVERGLFRMGADLKCPSCRLTSWVALDQLQQQVTCALCGTSHDATRQLVESECKYRRTGILGLEQNAQGAVPVALVLQQLSVNVFSGLKEGIVVPSIDVVPIDGNAGPCEVDVFAIVPGRPLERIEVLLGEVKDRGGAIDANDIANLRRVAAAFPSRQFEVFFLLAKLAPFTEDEVALAAGLMADGHVILLTDKELDPYHFYDRHPRGEGQRLHGGSLHDLAQSTWSLYPRLHPQDAAAEPAVEVVDLIDPV